jgi:predicted DNA-binding transcriptional regulator YafY
MAQGRDDNSPDALRIKPLSLHPNLYTLTHIETKESRVGNLPPKKAIQLAAAQYKVVDLLYMKKTAANKIIHREVEPYEFKIISGVPYFYGHCRMHNETHRFIMDNILQVEVTTKSYVPRWPVKIPAPSWNISTGRL